MAGDKLTRPVNAEALIQYENSSFNVNARRELYDEYAVPAVGLLDPEHPELGNWGMELEIMRSLANLGYRGEGPMADIGCGDARFVERYIERGHPGEIWAINYPATLFYPAEQAHKDTPNVRFVESRAERLVDSEGTPIPDDYFKMVSLNHLLYHLEDYSEALQEAYRVLAPGGLLVVSTKQEGNQGRLWTLAQEEVKEALEGVSIADVLELLKRIERLERRIARLMLKGVLDEDETHRVELLQESMERVKNRLGDAETLLAGVNPPESFYSHFDFEVEEQVLPQHGFSHTGESFRQFGKLRVPGTEEGWLSIKMALFSFKDMYAFPFDGYPGAYVPIHASTMMKAIDIGAKPVFDKQVTRKKKPYFELDVMMGFDIWQKPAA